MINIELSWCAILWFLSQTTDPAATFHRWREISFSPLDRATVIAVPLDPEIHAHTTPTWSDIRIFDQQGNSIPFLLRQRRRFHIRTERVFYPIHEYRARPLEPDGLEIEFHLPDDLSDPSGLRVLTSLKNFEITAQGWQWDDAQQTWLPVSEPTLLFDYSRYFDARHVEIPFSHITSHRLKLVIQQSAHPEVNQHVRVLARKAAEDSEVAVETTWTLHPIRIDGLQIYRDEPQQQVAEEVIDIQRFSPRIDLSPPRSNITILEFPWNQIPLVGLRLQLKQPQSYRRQISVQGRTATSDQWHTVAARTVTNLRLSPHQRWGDDVVSFLETRYAIGRVVIENGDSAPLSIEALEGLCLVYDLLGFVQPNQQLRLYYDDPDALPPQFDTAPIDAFLSLNAEPKQASLLEVHTQLPRRPWMSRSWLKDPGLWSVLIILAAVGVGLSIHRAAQRLPLS
ncbi:MAG: hypothetical protein KatS3mg113_0594 [Planctomycetaceae bacterium]|nr:MAG: hypothetical protein KatS3mg113_0594 [Planctomycetaceae bacterium]